MKFRIVSDDIGKTKEFLSEFRDLTKSEYDIKMKSVQKKLRIVLKKEMIPLYDCDWYEDKGALIFWNTFTVPKLVENMGIFNPFRGSIKEMEKNIKGFLEEKGVKAEVKLIEG